MINYIYSVLRTALTVLILVIHEHTHISVRVCLCTPPVCLLARDVIKYLLFNVSLYLTKWPTLSAALKGSTSWHTHIILYILHAYKIIYTFISYVFVRRISWTWSIVYYIKPIGHRGTHPSTDCYRTLYHQGGFDGIRIS